MTPFNAFPFENNGTLQKWQVTKTTPEIDKHDTQKNDALQKWHTLHENAQNAFLFALS